MRPPLSVSVTLAAALGLLPWTPPARAQEAAPPPGAAAPPTLAQALAQAEVSRDTVSLAVAADKVAAPKDMPPLPPGAPVSQVADAYGRLVQAWETAAAVAPPTMTLLNADPGTPDPYAGMPPKDAFKMLLAGLDDGQWRALTGAQGLGAGDLTAQGQRDLFRALFPGDALALQPRREFGDFGGGGGPDTAPQLTAQDLQGARLRLVRQLQVGLPVVGKDEWLDTPATAPGGQFTAYVGQGGDRSDTLYGVQVRATVPNAPKPSDLDPAAPAMRAPVALAGVKTVGDLIARIGAATRTELYADARYEKRGVTLVGPPSARAGDLLRALALDVAGTYRRVGPAYVLTDDVRGAGARRIILQRFAGEADLARHGALGDAGDRLVTARGGVDALPALDGDLALSDAQRARAAQDGSTFPNGQGLQVQAPLTQLTPEQQAAVRRQFTQYTSHHAADAPGTGEGALTLDRPILVMTEPTVLLLSPAAPGPVELDGLANMDDLFRPSGKLQQQLRQEAQARQDAAAKAAKPAPPATPAPAPPPPPSLASLLAPLPRRAVYARPRTAKDVDALVASLRAVGLNQLWLDVFSGGRSRLDDGPDGTPDILTEALAKTRGTGIAVVPTLDLLGGGPDAPDGARDLTMLGETSAQAKAHRQRYEDIMYQGMSPEDAAKQSAPTGLVVSPAAPVVVGTLTALVQRLAATPGVAGLALTDTVAPGYDKVADSHYSVQGDPLGYTAALRLALLRRAHVDPVDLEPESYEGQMNADTSLPEFDDYQATRDAAAQWDALRRGADLALMQGLLAAAQRAAGARFPVWVHQRRTTYQGDWWGLWADPRAPLPALPEEAAYGGSGPDTNYAALARAQSRLNVYSLQAWAGQGKDGLVYSLQQIKPGWDGFVLDYVSANGGAPDDGGAGAGDPLAALAKSLAPAAPPAPVKKP